MISPYVRRLRLAAEIRGLRAEHGLTHQQLAKKIGQSRAQISRLENGHVADQDDVMRILDALGIEGERWTQIMAIARDAGARGWWESNRAMGVRQALFANLEAGAATIREYQMTFVPGLLQTPQFAEARVDAERLARPTATYELDKVIDARRGRQRMLQRPGGPTYEVILDEVAVRRGAAPPEVVKSQLYHVAATVNGNSKLTLRVLPLDAEIDAYSVPRSSFSIYTFSDPGDPSVVAVDTVTDDFVLTEDHEVKQYVELHERLRRAAMSEEDSLALLVERAKADGP